MSGKLSGGKPAKPRGENGGKGMPVATSQRSSRLSASSSSSSEDESEEEESSSSGSGSSTSSDSEAEKGR